MTEPTTTTPSLLYLIKQVELAGKVGLDEAVADYGITSVQYTALDVLARNPGTTATRLARNSFVRIQSMAQLVNTLEARGLLRREPDPHSRRQNLLHITPAGKAIIDALRPTVQGLERQMLDGLSDEQAAAFVATLTHIRHAVSGAHPH